MKCRLCGQLKYNEAIDVVMEGALELFKAKQVCWFMVIFLNLGLLK